METKRQEKNNIKQKENALITAKDQISSIFFKLVKKQKHQIKFQLHQLVCISLKNTLIITSAQCLYIFLFIGWNKSVR